MTGSATPTTAQDRRRQFRQMLVGLIALPLSLVPFLTYGMFTLEGRIIRDRLIAAVSPPKLPELSAAQLQAAADGAPRYQGKVMALVYHGVGSTSDGDGGFVVSPRRFGEHLAMLKAAGMAAVTAADVARAFAAGAPLPDNAVLITFDDGRADAMMFSDPLLDQAGMRATMFLISSATDRPNLYYANWKRIAKAARSGRWDIQAHTHDAHREEVAEGGEQLPLLTSLRPGESLTEYRTRIQDDLDRNNEAIEDHIGSKPVAFAYPFGAYGADRTNDPQIRHILREEISARYLVAFHQDEQESVPLLDAGQDRMGLRRLEVGDWSGAELLDKLRQAAGGAGANGLAPDPEAGEMPSELVGPATLSRPEQEPVPDAIPEPASEGNGRAVRLRPGPATGSPVPVAPARIAVPPTASTSDPSSTTTTEPSTTTTSSTTTSTTPPTSSSTTTTTQPPTTTTTQPPTTTTTRPSGSTTTTTEKPCRGGRGDEDGDRDRDKPCRR